MNKMVYVRSVNVHFQQFTNTIHAVGYIFKLDLVFLYRSLKI